MATSIKKTLSQAVNFPQRFVQGRLRKTDTTIAEIQPGEGAVITVKGKKVAVYKNENNDIVSLSPVCTHLGCIVGWNGKERTWDCPCHGSRYKADGSVMKGPAKKNLKDMTL